MIPDPIRKASVLLCAVTMAAATILTPVPAVAAEASETVLFASETDTELFGEPADPASSREEVTYDWSQPDEEAGETQTDEAPGEDIADGESAEVIFDEEPASEEETVIESETVPVLLSGTHAITYSGISSEELSADPRYQQLYSDGQDITFPEPAARSGYTFKGWFLSADLTERVTGKTADKKLFLLTDSEREQRGITGDITLYPKFTGNRIRVILHASEDPAEEIGKAVPVELDYQTGIPQALPVNRFPAPAGGGVFRGWYEAGRAEGIDREDQAILCFGAEEGMIPIPTKMTEDEDPLPLYDLYARWDANSRITLLLPKDASITDSGSFLRISAAGDDPTVYEITGVTGQKITLPKKAVRPGFKFSGWRSAATGKILTAVNGKLGDQTLQAVFTPCTLTVRYNKNAPKNAVIDGILPASKPVRYAVNADGTPVSVAPEAWNQGAAYGGSHVFAGWFADKAGTVAVADLFADPPEKDRTLTLFAKWEPRSYQIEYRVWGTDTALAIAGAPSSGVAGVAVSLKQIMPPEEPGRVFKGWYQGTATALGKRITALPAKTYEDVTLYALFDDAYTIRLHGREASETAELNAATGKAVSLTKAARLPWGPQEGRLFAGWSIEPVGSVEDARVTYLDGDRVNLSADAAARKKIAENGGVYDLYAVYQVIGGTQTVRFLNADGTLAAQSTRQIGTAPAKTFLSEEVPSLTIPQGYTFGFWTDGRTGKKVTALTAKDYRPVVTLTAQINPKKVKVTYHNNLPEGVSGKAAGKAGMFSYDGSSKLMNNPFKVTGYAFVTWAADAAGVHPVGKAGALCDAAGLDAFRAIVTDADARTPGAALYAIWEPIVYTYRYDVTGSGSFSADAVTLPQLNRQGLRVPAARSGYRFTGWYRYKTDSAGRLVYDKLGDPVKTKTRVTKPVAADLALYAGWESLASARSVQVPDNAINVEDYGAYADDGKDDREAITNAIAAASVCTDDDPDAVASDSAIRTVYLPSGVYRIKIRPNGRGIDLTGWDIDSTLSETHEHHSNYVRILMEDDTVLKADTADLSSSVDHYSLFYLLWTDHVTIDGGIIDGNRSGVRGMGHAIDASGAANITIKNLTVQNASGDGIYLGEEKTVWAGPGQKMFRGSHIRIENCTVKNSRRNNIAIVGADDVTIRNCSIENANGLRPQSGIDIEPNPLHVRKDSGGNWIYDPSVKAVVRPCQNIRIENTKIHVHNNITGDLENHFCMLIHGGYSDSSICTARDVTIQNCRFYGDFYNGQGRNIQMTGTTVTGRFYDENGQVSRH